MNIAITGASSGVGQALKELLSPLHSVIEINRFQLDLDDPNAVTQYTLPPCDILINCAGHDLGGKVVFLNHDTNCITKILNANLIAPVLLSKQALTNNINCKIVTITSTNLNNYWGNDLAYTLSKVALHEFNRLLSIEYPNAKTLEIVLGLTKTNFNKNRHKLNHRPIDNLYEHKHLSAEQAAEKILKVMFNNEIRTIELRA